MSGTATKEKVKVLVLTKSVIISHLFDILSNHFVGYDFYACDQPDMAYIMYSEGNFDVAIIDPLSGNSNEIDNDILNVINEIKQENSTSLIAITAINIPQNVSDLFSHHMNLPLTPGEILNTLNNIISVKNADFDNSAKTNQRV
jgi:hypothetical protein